MITRTQALEIINEHVVNKNIIKHMLATEAMMGELARELPKRHPELVSGSNQMLKPASRQGGQVQHDNPHEFNVDEWKMAGLLHDGDYCPEVTVEKQGIQISKWVSEAGFEIPDDVKHAMSAHNWSNTGIEPKSKMDWALYAGDSLTGLIVAGALVLPSKRLADLTPESVLKRFKEPSFAKGTRREDILTCEKQLGISLEEFVKITLQSMQKIAGQIDL